MADDGGLSRIQKRLAAIPAKVKEAAAQAVVKGAEELADLQRDLAPVETGALKDSIHVTLPGETTPPYSQPGGQQVAPETGALVTVGNSEVRYPHLVEYGTADAPAQAFFWPAYRLLRKRITNRVKRSIRTAIKSTKNNG
ncbi:HK97-gp10 family putative phage morphogenesis protein [Labrys sp. 22185]|uniref:HK97-gp10 family putative phage morphogenesis protein n=1 Tax=Labrys sp. 22185 TaxID=3453888 RepID=UPI003F8579BE